MNCGRTTHAHETDRNKHVAERTHCAGVQRALLAACRVSAAHGEMAVNPEATQSEDTCNDGTVSDANSEKKKECECYAVDDDGTAERKLSARGSQ